MAQSFSDDNNRIVAIQPQPTSNVNVGNTLEPGPSGGIDEGPRQSVAGPGHERSGSERGTAPGEGSDVVAPAPQGTNRAVGRPKKQRKRNKKNKKRLPWYKQKEARENKRRESSRQDQQPGPSNMEESHTQEQGEEPGNHSAPEEQPNGEFTPGENQGPQMGVGPVVPERQIQEVIPVQVQNEGFGVHLEPDENVVQDQQQGERTTISSPVDDAEVHGYKMESGYYIHGPDHLSTDDCLRIHVTKEMDGSETVDIQFLSTRILPVPRYRSVQPGVSPIGPQAGNQVKIQIVMPRQVFTN